MESVGSEISSQMTTSRSWGWAFKNKWAERITISTKNAVRCLYPGCKRTYITKTWTTTGINNHLIKYHRITADSGINDGSQSRRGPLDALLHSSTQPRVFDPTVFDDLLVRFIVTTKQPFSIVKSPALQALLDHVTMASVSQVKLPSDDTVAAKVKYFSALNNWNCVLDF